MINYSYKCKRCGEYGVEEIDDWLSQFCPGCNDGLIEESNERREFEYYHSNIYERKDE